MPPPGYFRPQDWLRDIQTRNLRLEISRNDLIITRLRHPTALGGRSLVDA
jgi:hypothetical protein